MSPDPIDDEMVIIYQSADVTSAHTEVAGPDELGIGDVSYVRDDRGFRGTVVQRRLDGRRDGPWHRRSHEDLAPIAGDLSEPAR